MLTIDACCYTILFFFPRVLHLVVCCLHLLLLLLLFWHHSCRLDIQKIYQPLDGDVIYAVGFSGSTQFVMYQISAKSGEIIKHISTAFPGSFSGELSFVHDDMLVALDSTRLAIISITLENGDTNFHKTYIKDLVPDFSGTASILPSKFNGMFALQVNSNIMFIRAKSGHELEMIQKVNDPAAISDSLSLLEGRQAFGMVHHEEGKIFLTVKLDHDFHGEFLKESINMDGQRGLVQKVFINNYLRTDRSNGFRALIVMEDHSLLLLQQGEIVWSREDGLASIVDMTTSELPVEKKGVSVTKVEQNLFEWLKVCCLSFFFLL